LYWRSETVAIGEVGKGKGRGAKEEQHTAEWAKPKRHKCPEVDIAMPVFWPLQPASFVMAESLIRRLRSSYGSATAATELLYLETLLMHPSRKKRIIVFHPYKT
jgi:hypothetical protein